MELKARVFADGSASGEFASGDHFCKMRSTLYSDLKMRIMIAMECQLC